LAVEPGTTWRIGLDDSVMKYEIAGILDAIDAGIVTADASGRVSSLNTEALRLLDHPITDVRELLGSEIEEQVAADEREVTVELQPDGSPARRLRVTRHAPPGSEPATVLVLRDVTEARRAHDFREAFLGMLSHELRTPVTSIHAAATLMRTRDHLEATVKEGLVADIAEEADRLMGLVEDLLVLAQSDEGIRLSREPVLVQRCVPPAVERERRRWPRLEVDIRVESDLPVVAGDEAAIEHVIRNLIANAGRYGGALIVVELRASGDREGAEVHVLDQGPGVEPAETEDLFRPFFRSSRTAGMPSGAGVGLCVGRQLVQAMDGRMWARQRDGGGSDFGFWLPACALDPDE